MCCKVCSGFETRYDMQPLLSAESFVTMPSAGNDLAGAKSRETCSGCQARENAQPLSSTGEKVTEKPKRTLAVYRRPLGS